MDKKDRTKLYHFLPVFGALCLFLGFILIICFFLNGQIRVSGAWPEPVISATIVCQMEDVKYPIYDLGQNYSSNTKINMIFEDENIESISLIRRMHFDTEDEAKIATQSLDFEINKSMEQDGLGFGALSNNFSQSGTSTRMNLFASKKDINSKSLRYFMLQSNLDNIDEYLLTYEKQGFKCLKNV